MPGGNAGLMWCLSRWTDGALFDLAVKTVLGAAGDDLPKDFADPARKFPCFDFLYPPVARTKPSDIS